MFKEFGQMMGMMKDLGKVREEMEALKTRVGKIEAEGEAGGGMVKVKVNGQMEILKCTLSDEALKGNDRELLEDLIVAACNQAIKNVKKLTAEEAKKMATGLGLPPGMGLPGL